MADIPSIWVVSYSAHEAYLTAKSLQLHFSDRSVKHIKIKTDLTGNEKIENVIHTANSEIVVFFIERDGLQNSQYREIAEWCRQQVDKRDDFRFYLCFSDISMQEFSRLCDESLKMKAGDPGFEGYSLLNELRDSVQIHEFADSDELSGEIRNYLNSRRKLKLISFFRRLKLKVTSLLGTVAGISQILIFCAAIVLSVSILIPAVLTLKEYISFIPPDISALLSGAAVPPVCFVLLFFVSRGSAFRHWMLKRDRKWLLFYPIFAYVVFYIYTIFKNKMMPVTWVWFGFAAGAALDAIRRSGKQARRDLFSLRSEIATPRGKMLPWKISKVTSDYRPDPWSCPILPDYSARVFISYTHSSEWSNRMVEELRKNLKALNIECFLDRYDIYKGSSWRRQLHDRMADANVFIAVADENSIRKSWPAAEMETALTGRYLTGIPEMIVLVEPGFLSRKNDMVMPVFDALFRDGVRRINSPVKTMEVKESSNMLQILASGFDRDHFSTAGSIPGLLTNCFRTLVLVPASIAGSAGSFLGVLFLIAALLTFFGISDIRGYLASISLLQPICLLSGYMLGFVSRLLIGSLFEITHNDKDTNRLSSLNMMAALGLTAFIIIFSVGLSAIILAWTILLFVYGYFTGKGFILAYMQRRVYREYEDRSHAA